MNKSEREQIRSINEESSYLKIITRLLPLLILYIVVVLIASRDVLWGDEGRYLMYASNLLKGYYSPQDQIMLWNGPGYPIFLMPFILLKLPFLTVKLFNALLLFMAILYFYYTLRSYMREKPALFFSYVLGLYPPFCRYSYLLLTEQLSIFLVCGFMFHFCKLNHDKKNSLVHLLITSFYLGYLALTKIFYGYVILSGLLLFLTLYLWKRENTFKKTFIVYLLALLVCVPYLFYTYSLTGKLFYWGNSGGIGLYIMSSPYEDELGGLRVRQMLESQNHKSFLESLNKKNLSEVERDEAFKQQAVQNIINYPTKYMKNWLANVGRLLFNYPYSYELQKLTTYFYIVPNMFLVVFCFISAYFSYVGNKLIPFEIYAMLLFALIVFGGSSMSYAESRYLSPSVPLIALWISFILIRVIKVEIRQ